MEWHGPAKEYLNRLGRDEYSAQRKAHKGSPKKFRFSPSEYMVGLIECLNVNNEEAFKAHKMLSGYASATGV